MKHLSCPNHPYLESSRTYALGGMIESTMHVVLVAQGTQVFRFTSSPLDAPSANPNDYQTAEAYYAARAQLRGGARPVLEGLTKGCWWTAAAHMYALKAQSLHAARKLEDIARHASAVKYAWSHMDFLVTARVKPFPGLVAFRGKGKDMEEDLPGGGKVKLIADPNIDQLYIPGLHEATHVPRYLTIEDVQALRPRGR